MSQSIPQIIALGGGGFSLEPGVLSFVPYILETCGKKNPRILYIPTAKGDADSDILGFYTTVTQIDCKPSHLSLFQQPKNMAEYVSSADIIFVGGGNTRNMLAIWRVSGLDVLLRQAWEKGTLLCGESAGAICWFEVAQTKASGEPGTCDGLGFLAGSCSSHFDADKERRPHFHACIADGSLPAGYGISDGAALHFKGTELEVALAGNSEAKAYWIENQDGKVVERELPVVRSQD